MGANLFSKSNLSGDTVSNLDISSLVSALSGLTGSGKGFDVGSLVNNFDAGGLGDLAKSWLGDGENAGISPEQISNALDSDKKSEFASKLGINVDEAAGGLPEALPQMVDRASSGCSIFDSTGGAEGALGFAKKLFGKTTKEVVMGIFSWILMGLIVGIVAKFIMPGKDPGGLIVTILLGIAGAFFGGYIGSFLGLGDVTGFNLGSLLLAVGGAILLLILYRVIKK